MSDQYLHTLAYVLLQSPLIQLLKMKRLGARLNYFLENLMTQYLPSMHLSLNSLKCNIALHISRQFLFLLVLLAFHLKMNYQYL